MSVDYDLVVIGGGRVGMSAAVRAARLRARVALVEQGVTLEVPAAIDHAVLLDAGHRIRQLHSATEIGLSTPSLAEPSLVSTRLVEWAQAVRTKVAAPRSPAVLSSLGIEVITDSGEFYRKPNVGFVVGGRALRSRAYLLAALPYRSVLPDIDDGTALQAMGYLTPKTILQRLPTLQPSSSIVIVGPESAGVELAQALVRLRFQVTLIVRGACILSRADPEAACLLQAQLEADGVQVLTQTTVTQVRDIAGKKWVQTEDWAGKPSGSSLSSRHLAIEADEILLATGYEPDATRLNLDAVNIRCGRGGIEVNRYLQTAHPRVYACTQARDDNAPQWAVERARVAVNNALFLPVTTFDDRAIPSVVYTDPELAQVGLTAPEAVQQYGKDVVILRQTFKSLARAEVQGELTGFCKFVVRRNGRLLGATIVGPQASELIGTIALALQQQQSVQTLAKLVLPTGTLAEILSQTANEWQRLRFQQNTLLQNLVEGWLNLRRS